MTNKSRLFASVAGAALIATTYDPTPAFSQSMVLEEIVVTARKREESLQDLPLTVTAFTGSDLEHFRV